MLTNINLIITTILLLATNLVYAISLNPRYLDSINTTLLPLPLPDTESSSTNFVRRFVDEALVADLIKRAEPDFVPLYFTLAYFYSPTNTGSGYVYATLVTDHPTTDLCDWIWTSGAQIVSGGHIWVPPSLSTEKLRLSIYSVLFQQYSEATPGMFIGDLWVGENPHQLLVFDNYDSGSLGCTPSDGQSDSDWSYYLNAHTVPWYEGATGY
jgi:hypothetical protein